MPGVRLWHWQHPDIEGRSGTDGVVAIPDMMPGRFDFQVAGRAEDRLPRRHLAKRLRPRARKSVATVSFFERGKLMSGSEGPPFRLAGVARTTTGVDRSMSRFRPALGEHRTPRSFVPTTLPHRGPDCWEKSLAQPPGRVGWITRPFRPSLGGGFSIAAVSRPVRMTAP